ncbi:MAG: hypothetical protein ACM31O_03890 [Bacteroidota bacterium]
MAWVLAALLVFLALLNIGDLGRGVSRLQAENDRLRHIELDGVLCTQRTEQLRRELGRALMRQRELALRLEAERRRSGLIIERGHRQDS